ncbi:MAG: flippase [Candidatus Pacebacteria bacterium]|nr:flippase [Candidatus Paceibacterota bacterium]
MNIKPKNIPLSEQTVNTTYDTKSRFIVQLIPEIILQHFRGRETFQQVFKNTLWMTVYTFILPFLAAFFVNAWIARYLGPDQFGILTYIFTFSSIFLSINYMGLDAVVFRNLCNDDLHAGKILGTATILRLIAGVVSLILGVIIFSNVNHGDQFLLGMVFIALTSNIAQAFNVIEGFFQSRLQVKSIAVVRIIVIISISIAKILAVISHAPLSAFIVLGSSDAVLSALLLYLMFRKVKNISIWTFDFKYAKQLLRDGFPLMLAGLTFALYTKLDQIILKSFQGNSQLGQYAIALGVVEAFNFLPLVITNSIAPLVVASVKQDGQKYSLLMVNIYRVMFLLSIVVGVGLFFVGRHLIPVIFGKEYLEASRILAFLQFRLFFTCMSVARGLFITSKGMFKLSLVSQVFALIVGLSFNFWLIPIYGVYGLLLSSLASFIISIFIVDIFHPLGRQNFSYVLRAISTPHLLKFSTAD